MLKYQNDHPNSTGNFTQNTRILFFSPKLKSTPLRGMKLCASDLTVTQQGILNHSVFITCDGVIFRRATGMPFNLPNIETVK